MIVGKPSKPTNLRVTEVWKDYITVTWEPPLKDGGSPLMGYTVEQRDALEVGFKFVASVNATQTLYQVIALIACFVKINLTIN
jgi:Fibronectin type III domain